MRLEPHDLLDTLPLDGVRVEHRPVRTRTGRPAEGLHATWILLDNPSQLNSYTTAMVKSVILAFRAASNDRRCVAVVFSAVGDRAFCTGGNTKEYAEYYAGRPEEYAQYMRLFNDMVTGILTCDKPVICRVNGMRVGGGQEIGMACDYSIAQDNARFGQAGPRHGSAPDGGSTDFLPLYVGIEHAMYSCTACELWSAHKAHRLGLLTSTVPALRDPEGRWVPNPLVWTDGSVDEYGRSRHGEPKTGADLDAGKAVLKRCTVDLALLDAEVDSLIGKLLDTFPGCLTKTIGSIRAHKRAHWDKNRESNRAWLALNMMTEANAGFRAFNEGDRDDREIDFAALRLRLAEGEKWSEELIRAVGPAAMRRAP
ncbi:MAG: 6-oxocyclohex-1-ene-1-carbonyl-CoA hydratase [Pseudomonadota bacterium]|nr:6-oxocyclohex-1-ene-1-carbonyl-CoA hydratase [Pseudomonadota bacterium]